MGYGMNLPFLDPTFLVVVFLVGFILLIVILVVPPLRKAFGLVLIVVGILLSITVIGAIVGLPLVFIGAVLLFIGGKKKEVIKEVRYVPSPRPVQPVSTYTATPSKYYCPECGTQMTYLSLHENWYCHKCDEYFDVKR